MQYENNKIICSFAPNTPNNFSTLLLRFLKEQTNREWLLKVEQTGGQPSLKEQKDLTKQELLKEIKKDPAVAQIEKLFAGAKIDKIKPHKEDEEEPDIEE